ncbi:MAG: Npt1/Npt2 family nucleotide transporter [Desulfobacterales bacterium]|jgi:AAA family ATP:ADP antiporter
MQAQNSKNDVTAECEARYPMLRTLGARAGFLFLNFFLIIMALYQLKPASRSLFIETLGAERLPYIWIATAVTMGAFITYYHRLVERHSRINVVLGTCLTICGLLIAFRLLLKYPGPIVPACFYVFVDILGVVLVEQFWSLTNSIYTTHEGKSWYGLVGTGGLVGGVAGGWVSAMLIKHTPLQTPDLLLTAAGIIGTIFALTWLMGRVGIYCEVEHVVRPHQKASGGWRILGHSRYLLLIAAILLLAQLASPLVEYQFLNTVESAYPDREARTAFLSLFFSVLGILSIGVNLGITPLVHRYLGAIAGLLVQPLMIFIFSWCFFLQSTLFFSSATKISDRALSYSINRASKELLYVPVDSVLIYQAKAWIDMFGYRLFKVTGSVVILLFTQWLPFKVSVPQLSWFTISICTIWIAIIFVLRLDYQGVCEASANR